MIPSGEDSREARREMELQATDDAWDDLFSRARDALETIRNTPLRNLKTSELLVLAHDEITSGEPLDAINPIYEAWKRLFLRDSR